ncbi:aminotransferase class I/II-fold pyridoxal phosphate-dependent enzyme [Tabrizicola flagellatus]|uniref:aminotransferase class I/II-fold pyridoxal phosphate-dependent enzyme n=1 Tax=Tabrizicola flagellatus TaxID=2593021 RepID=UPI0011F39279|nr:aminotransferase class I/II-fold pyridoxal phosphate-dependent enzyme [Tabrizicola flagellatus]
MPGPARSDELPGADAQAVRPRDLIDGGPLRDFSAHTDARRRPRLDFATRDPLGLGGLSVSEPFDPCLPDPHPRPGADLATVQDGPVKALERRIASELRLPEAVAFASAADAIRLVLSSVLRPGDVLLVDAGADAAFLETGLASRAGLFRFPFASLEGVERRLRRLAGQPDADRVFIVVPTVSAHGSRVADLADLCLLAREYGARLIVDLAQDFGVMGQDGCGVMEIQGCLGRVDLVLGCFAAAFGATGGFAAWRDPDLTPAPWRDNPGPARLSADRAAVILAAAEVVFSPEGRHRRRRLHGLSLRLRNHLMADGLRVPGSSAPFVPVLLPADTALPRTALLESAGPRVGLLMAPQVPIHAPRWRIELSALHGLADIDDLADLIRDVSRAFDRLPARRTVPA